MKFSQRCFLFLVFSAFLSLVVLSGCGGSGGDSGGGGWYGGGTSAATAPQVTSVTFPNNIVTSGSPCTISGTGFGSSRDGGSSYVSFYDTQSSTAPLYGSSYPAWSDTSIICYAPGFTTGRTYTVVVNVVSNGVTVSSSTSPESSNQVTTSTVTPPSITSISPSTVNTGSNITITGSNFGEWQTSNYVVAGTVPVTVISWVSNSIVCTIPSTTSSGTVQVYVHTDAGGNSSTFPVTVSGSSSALPGKYLLTFHVRDISGGVNTSDNTKCMVQFAYSDDSITWTPVPNFTPFKGSAPDLLKRGNTVYFYTPDPDIVTRYNASTGTMTSGVPVVIKQSDGTNDDYGDISPYLDPSTNKIVIFYKSTKGYSGDPQYGTLPVCSATEVEGSDGTQFTKDDGNRIAPLKHADASIFFDGTQYILYVGYNPQSVGEKPKTYVYTCSTLRGTYNPISTLPGGLLTESGSVPCGYYDPVTAKYWTYITLLSPTSAAVIKRASHSDFSRQLTDSDFTTVVSNTLYPGLKTTDSTESPGFKPNN
ncbi:MAG: IPT/TIG domain-containing protein [Candidatus Eremiobacteraeota bacterium]|nr:IPT/TIG domain-containing protein [Candidatus Eremiobacteraeota bacterium]